MPHSVMIPPLHIERLDGASLSLREAAAYIAGSIATARLTGSFIGHVHARLDQIAVAILQDEPVSMQDADFLRRDVERHLGLVRSACERHRRIATPIEEPTQ